MKLNTILIIAGIVVLLVAQFYLFRFQNVSEHLILNRYTGKTYIAAYLMGRIEEEPESDKIKTLNDEIKKLNDEIKNLKNDNNENKYDFDLASKIIDLQKRKLSYVEGINSNITVTANRLCYMMKCYDESDYQVKMDGKLYWPDDVKRGIRRCRDKLENDINNKAPE